MRKFKLLVVCATLGLILSASVSAQSVSISIFPEELQVNDPSLFEWWKGGIYIPTAYLSSDIRNVNPANILSSMWYMDGRVCAYGTSFAQKLPIGYHTLQFVMYYLRPDGSQGMLASNYIRVFIFNE